MASQVQDSGRLQELLGAFHIGAATREETHSKVLDLILERIGCSRVSMWHFEREGAALNLLCFASKGRGEPFSRDGRRLSPAAYGSYFAALIESGVHASSDALADPRLAPTREVHLLPNGVVSLLDAAFLLNNRAYGRVCCEQTVSRRAWPASDVSALRGIVNKLALLMWSAPSPVLPAMPSLAVGVVAAADHAAGRRRAPI